jgi:Family of unknown function (DUF5670)
MFETVAMILLALWVAGLITGNVLGGLIHVLLLGGLVSLFFHYRAVSRAQSAVREDSARLLTHAMGKPIARRPIVAAKPGQKRPSRPSAAA